MNSITIVGRLTKLPELRWTQSGQAVCGFDVANEVGFGDNKQTVFFKCAVWGKMGESCDKYLVKGQEVTIVGELSQEEYNRRDGGKATSLKVNVKQISFGAKPRGESEQENYPSRRTESNYQGGNRTQSQRPKDRQEDEQERLAREAARRERERLGGDDDGGDGNFPF